MRRVLLILFLTSLMLSQSGMAQEPQLYHFRFEVADKSMINHLSTLISIDRLDGKTVYAYANEKEFKAFLELEIEWTAIEDSKSAKSIDMATTLADMALWNKYPTYEVYEQMMQGYVTSYPEICKLFEIGTLASGRKLLALKISDNINLLSEAEPQLLFTSTMHGDEMGGFIVLLRLIDHLIKEYTSNSNSEITRLVNGSAIWINPLANPDGTYKGGNHTVAGAIRTNANYVDLNRNFPDPAAGDHPDGNLWQKETQLMMAFADSIPFNLAVNIHSGEEVVNYPWDTWSAASADDLWWKYVGSNYRDSAQANGPAGYFTGVSDGLSNGYDWYRITGGRQDYMNYFKNCREFTLEITNTDFYPSTSLPNLWNYNRGALLGYLAEGLNGVQGTVFNSNGAPLAAVINVLNHDFTNSEVYSNTATGFFARYLKSGSYSLKISSPGYFDSIVPNVTITDGMATPTHVILKKQQGELCLLNDSIEIQLFQNESTSTKLLLLNCGNFPYTYSIKTDSDSLPIWLSINKTDNSIPVGATDTLVLDINTHSLMLGTYRYNLIIQADETVSIPILLNVVPIFPITVEPETLHYKIASNISVLDTVWLINKSLIHRNVNVLSESNWLQISGPKFEIAPNDSVPVSVIISNENLNTGFYTTHILVTGEARAKIGVELTVDTLPIIQWVNSSKTKEVLLHTNSLDTLWLTNIGGGKAIVSVATNKNWIQPVVSYLEVHSGDTVPLQIFLETNLLEKGIYSALITLTSENNAITQTLQVSMDDLPELAINVDILSLTAKQGLVYTDSLILSNRGGDTLLFEITSDLDAPWLTVNPTLGQISSGDIMRVQLAFDAREIAAGEYNASVMVNNKPIAIALRVEERTEIQLNKQRFYVSLEPELLAKDTLLLSNEGNKTADYSLSVSRHESQQWIEISNHSGSLQPGSSETIMLSFSAEGLPRGVYRTHLEINDGKITRIPIVMEVVMPAK